MSLKKENTTPALAVIWTEGKTDWRIYKKALQSLGSNLQISFHESNKDMGGDRLLKSLQTFAEKENSTPLIFVFDNDNTFANQPEETGSLTG